MDKPSTVPEVEDEVELEQVAEVSIESTTPTDTDFEPGLIGRLDREFLM